MTYIRFGFLCVIVLTCAMLSGKSAAYGWRLLEDSRLYHHPERITVREFLARRPSSGWFEISDPALMQSEEIEARPNSATGPASGIYVPLYPAGSPRTGRIGLIGRLDDDGFCSCEKLLVRGMVQRSFTMTTFETDTITQRYGARLERDYRVLDVADGPAVGNGWLFVGLGAVGGLFDVVAIAAAILAYTEAARARTARLRRRAAYLARANASPTALS